MVKKLLTRNDILRGVSVHHRPKEKLTFSGGGSRKGMLWLGLRVCGGYFARFSSDFSDVLFSKSSEAERSIFAVSVRVSVLR